MQACSQCNLEKIDSEFPIRKETGRIRKDCKECIKKRTSAWVRKNPEKHRESKSSHYQLNKEKIKKYVTEWGKNNPEKRQRYCMSWRWNLRLEIIKEYGGKCKCCGENIPEFLTIDHIHDDGGIKRKLKEEVKGGSFYRWLKEHGFPKDNFQLLCMNCNFAKGHFGGCPHND